MNLFDDDVVVVGVVTDNGGESIYFVAWSCCVGDCESKTDDSVVLLVLLSSVVSFVFDVSCDWDLL